MSFENLVDQINHSAKTQRDRGTYFEYLVRAYLQHEPTYKNEFKNVWMLADVPDTFAIPKVDIGVDLVAEKFTGELVAVQAKFYDHTIQKANIDSFLSELGKDYYESGIIVASTDKWGKNAEKALADRSDVVRIGLSDLKNSQINWEKFSFEQPEQVVVKEKKKPRYYQREVIEASLSHFKAHDRGQLIMAPGTGKTFTSLKVAEALAKEANKEQFVILYLVPSIQLLTQTLRGWNNDAELSLSSMAVTSDRNASRGNVKQDESNITIKASDIGYPATTSAEKIMANYSELLAQPKKDLLVVFSTYQSIEVLGKAQKDGFPEFDLIIADEAHRTTGAKALGEEASAFTKVHSDLNIKGKKRLYQTATPKLYGREAKKKAESNSIVISSMDDEALYGKVFFRLGFGDAISHGILTDYKLMVLAVDETVVQRDMQKSLSDAENGLNIDDVGRIIGVWNGMIKRETFSDTVSGEPMKRAIAFSRTIKDSKQLSEQFENVVNDYLDNENGFSVNVRHVDGGMNALEKGEALDWLASEDIPEDSARILSNVRFLTEGIDVPNLDAIIFLSPRKSSVDIVQAVGRIIRKSEGKEYGYIILPIVVPSGETPETILDNNKTYDVIWQVLNALRSVDERFEATINKLELNKSKPKNIQVIGVGSAPDDPSFQDSDVDKPTKEIRIQTELELDWKAVEGAIYGKIVQKVGDRRYLEDWSKDVADIARRHIQGIQIILEKNPESKEAFERFLHSLQHNINESIDQEQAIEMLAQHLITKPIFDALFDEYSFIKHNPVSQAMELIIDEFSQYGFEKEQKELQPFYDSVRLRAEGIDNAQAKQKIIITLYDKFFSTGFKATTEKLGIVFTPVEVVDFIVKSVDTVLRQHFGKTLASENVHILDPFTGTGTFITRTLHYFKQMMDKGEITYADVLRKYTKELHANEIVLLSYYIAAINIEAVFDEINGDEPYQPFEGIVLTDTFESTETEDTLDDSFFGANDQRLKRQQEQPITAIIGNPPYSIGQGSENDNNQNITYPKLDNRLYNTYVQRSNSTTTKGMYDTYIKAFRWASDRLSDKGVIGFVTNGAYLNTNSADGLRAGLYEDFNYLYIFNLRGDQRTIGEKSRQEGGKIFGSGSRTPVAISILVKDGSDKHELLYHDIGDYLSQKEKLQIIENFGDISAIDWQTIQPDANNDWLNQRDPNYQKYASLAGEDDCVFFNNALGVNTNRDIWVYGFNKENVIEKVKRLIDNYNEEVKKISQYQINEREDNLTNDESLVKWTSELKKQAVKLVVHKYKTQEIEVMYRPFTKKWLYYDKDFVHRIGKYYKKFGQKNLVITTTGRGTSRDFSVIVTNLIPDVQLQMNGQGFMRYDNEVDETQLFQSNDNINQAFADKLGLSLDDTFAYIYGLLNARDYQEKYANDLKKDLARIPIVKHKEKYVEVGKSLMNLHLNYEEVSVYEAVTITPLVNPTYKVTKMRFAKTRDENGKSVNDRSTIIFNHDITISNIPEKAYQYVVNGRSAIEWIMDQYQVKTDKKSGITDDPNDYSTDEKYIFNLLLRIINVSIQTVDLIESLPPFEVEE